MNDLRERYDFLFDGSGDLTQETLLLYVFGPLETEARQAVELHLDECEMCRDAAEGMALLGIKEQALAALAATDAKLLERLELLKQKVTRDGREELINQSATKEPMVLKVEKREARIVWYRYAAAACLFVVIGAAFWMFNQNLEPKGTGISMTQPDTSEIFNTGKTRIGDQKQDIAQEETLSTAGDINLVDTGGVSSYNFAWTSGDTVVSLPAAGANGFALSGTYTLTITDANTTAPCPEKPGEIAPSLATNEEKKREEVAEDEETASYELDRVVAMESSAVAKEAEKDLAPVPTEDVAVSKSSTGANSGSIATTQAPSLNKGSSDNNFYYNNVAGMDAAVGEAQYPGGSMEVQKYFDKIVYPANIAKGYKGVVTFEVSFDKKGRITNTRLVSGLGEPYDKLLLDHLKKMPNWEAPQPMGEPIASTRLVAVEVTVR